MHLPFVDVAKILKQSDQYECRLIANAVVLILGGYQISTSENLRWVSTYI